MILFDIETAPAPDEILKKFIPPFDDSGFQPTEFDPKSVKVGNLKPDNAKAKIEGRRKEHEREQANLSAAREAALNKHRDDFRSKAALSATTGRVVAIGYHSPEKQATFVSAVCSKCTDGELSDESKLILTFWEKFVYCQSQQRIMAGLNIHQFDLPFLVRRSWILGLEVPSGVFTFWKHRIQWNELFVDLRIVWLLGQSWGSCKSDFSTLAAAFGTGGKPEGMDGSQFAEMWETDREKAINYLSEDVEQPAEWCHRMQVT